MKGLTIKRLIASTLLVCASTVSVAHEPPEPMPDPIDPFETFNRGMYGFNRNLDSLVIKPVAWTYKHTVPEAFRTMGSNFFKNLNLVPTFFNDILQGKFRIAAQDFSRLSLNSTLGILGFFDVASDNGLSHRSEDFGQTLMTWGYKDSTYVVWPLLGPSTIRDTIGKVPDYFMSPEWHLDTEDSLALTAAEVIQVRSDLFDAEKIIKSSSTDEYVFVRHAYLQNRKYENMNGDFMPHDEDDDMLGEPPE